DDVRDDHVLEVYERYHYEGVNESEVEGGLDRETEFREYRGCHDAGQHLDERVDGRDAGAAVGAFAAEGQVSEDGDVVVEPYGLAAGGAVRRREDDGFFTRKPVDADVQEAADDGAEYESEDVQQGGVLRHLIFPAARSWIRRW